MADNPIQKSFSLLVAAAFADGDIGDAEMAMLLRKASDARIPSERVQRMVAEARQGQLRLSYPSSREERTKRLDDILDILCVDGRLETPERQFMLRYTTSLGGIPEDLNDRIRARMRRAARVESKPVEIMIDTMPDSHIRIGAPPERPQAPPPPPRPPIAAGAPAPEPPAAGPATLPHATAAPEVETIAPRPPGPVELAPPQLLGASVLPPITLALVRQVIEFEGSAEAAQWLERSCLMEPAAARETVEQILRADPSLKPAARRILPRR